MIGTSDGKAYEDETDFHLGRPVQLDSVGTLSTPEGYDDGPTQDQKNRDEFYSGKPTVGKLKDQEKEFEDNIALPVWDQAERNVDRTPSPQNISDKLLQSPYERAQAAMDLNPQERSLYERHLSNLNSKGGVNNPDGSRSSLYVGTYGVDDKTYVLPRVRDGKILDADAAFQAAKKEGLDKFPSYDTRDAAEKRYQQMHNFMEEDTKSYLEKQTKDPFKTKVEGKNQDRVPNNAPFPNPAAPEQTIASKIRLDNPRQTGPEKYEADNNYERYPDDMAYDALRHRYGEDAVETLKWMDDLKRKDVVKDSGGKSIEWPEKYLKFRRRFLKELDYEKDQPEDKRPEGTVI